MKWVKHCAIGATSLCLASALADQLPELQQNEISEEEIARQVESPVSNLRSFYFQNHFNFGVGPTQGLQYVLDIAPVYPIRLSSDGWRWNHRPDFPLISQPSVVPGQSASFGQGDLQYQAYFSPPKTGRVNFGFGPLFVFPTAVSAEFGSGKWSVGPGGVVLAITGPWVAGLVMNQIWSFAGDQTRSPVSELNIEPFLFLNLASGWYFNLTSTQSANWEAPSGKPWTVTIGGGVGKVILIGDQAINFQVGAFDNVVSSPASGGWSFRFQFGFLFPGDSQKG